MKKIIVLSILIAFTLGGCALFRNENLGYIYRTDDQEIYVGGRGSAWIAVVDQVDESTAPPFSASSAPDARIRVTTRRTAP